MPVGAKNYKKMNEIIKVYITLLAAPASSLSFIETAKKTIKKDYPKAQIIEISNPIFIAASDKGFLFCMDITIGTA